jgi:sugar phosphate isomerase/epimerase
MAVRLGGPIFTSTVDPDEWARAVQAWGYRAMSCPVGPEASDDVVRAYERAAQQADILISEVGAWSNPLSPDETTRCAAMEKCKQGLALAERIGANCCVNIVGSCGAIWDGPHPNNLTQETFDRIVDTVREIIDSVQPTRAFYTLEAMPWMYPTGPQDYLRLIHAIDRAQFGVHLDPVNMVFSPERYFGTTALIQECFATLGPYIKNCHAKDILLRDTLTVHLDEVRPGLGNLDYVTYLRELDRLDAPVGLLLEHLPNEEEYRLAAAHIRSVADSLGIAL